VLIHGFNKGRNKGPIPFVELMLREMRVDCFCPITAGWGSISERSKSLIAQIAQVYRNRTVHLFGHSMGGINARDIASQAMQFDLGFKVKTVTTFGSPHRGVPWIPLHGISGSCALANVIRAVFSTDLAAVGNLSKHFMQKFNGKMVTNDNSDVAYFSWAGKISVPALDYLDTFGPSAACGETDGLVNVDSASWGPDLGPGTHLGTVRGLNHKTLMCRMTIRATIVHVQAVERGLTACVQPVNNSLGMAINRRLKDYETVE